MLPTSREVSDSLGMDINFVLVVMRGEIVVHLVGYENKPHEHDIAYVGSELQFDKEHNLTDVPVDELSYMVFTAGGYDKFLEGIEYEDVPPTLN